MFEEMLCGLYFKVMKSFFYLRSMINAACICHAHQSPPVLLKILHELKTRSDKIILSPTGFDLFDISKKEEKLRTELSLEDKITNLLGFLT